MNYQKGIALVIVIFITIFIIAGGIFAWQYLGAPNSKDWKTYKNEQYGYKIKYPQNYYVFDNYPNEILFSDKPNGQIDFGGVIIGVHVGDKNSALEYTGQSKKVLVGGLEGYLYDYLIEGTGKTLILPTEEEYFFITINVRGDEKDKYYSIFDQMLPTFKFLK